MEQGAPREGLAEVRRFRGDEVVPDRVAVVREAPLTVFYNGLEVITLLCTPDHPDELAVGFLAAEGFLRERGDLLEAAVDAGGGTVQVTGRADASLARRLMEKRTVTSGCGKGTTFYHALDALQARPAGEGPRTTPARLAELAGEALRGAAAGRGAGGVHHAALCGTDGTVLLREDIGRHNAIDKLHGRLFLDGRDARGLFLVTTGRVTSEILVKAAKMGLGLVVSPSKPTLLALELAERLGISVVGRLRGTSGIVYTDRGRLA